MTKKIYNQPEIQIAQFASMSLMQAASPTGNTMGMSSIITDEQW